MTETLQPVNTELLAALRGTDHPLLLMHPDDPKLPRGTCDVLVEARTAHHLLDMVNVPQGDGLDGNLDARVWRAAMRILALSERLSRLLALHVADAKNGMVCQECIKDWPCESYLLATGQEE